MTIIQDDELQGLSVHRPDRGQTRFRAMSRAARAGKAATQGIWTGRSGRALLDAAGAVSARSDVWIFPVRLHQRER